ncbi:MAG TPA: putative peptidoglycan glycosyltransferase FtsW, partial [Blastocatellia bacterium]|nr:putative peptidoglycan glycosyltransferase FtsW [Blastocatellia bacterium]
MGSSQATSSYAVSGAMRDSSVLRNARRPRWKRDQSGHSGRGGSQSSRELPIDKLLLAVVLGLVLFGAVMVYSASAVLAQKEFDNQFHFLARQGMWAALGIMALVVGMCIDYRHYKHPAVIGLLLIVTFSLLCAVFFFPKINGTHRWIRFGSYFSLQPSELAKLALVAFLAFFIERKAFDLDDLKHTVLPASLIAAAMIGLVGAETDLGTALILGVIFASVTFYAGFRMRHLLGLAAMAAPVVAGMVFLVSWRQQRIWDFLDPWKNQTTSSFQIVQSLIAIGSGGTSGVGFAQGKQKLFYLPAPHTDFIFAVIGEELGLIGAATVVLLFAIVAWRGFRAARSAPDVFGQLM